MMTAYFLKMFDISTSNVFKVCLIYDCYVIGLTKKLPLVDLNDRRTWKAIGPIEMSKKAVKENTKEKPSQSLKKRFLKSETDGTNELDLLELLLTYVIKGRDVRPLAQELIRKFGSLSQVLSATPREIEQIKGIGQSSIILLKIVQFIKIGSFSQDTSPSLSNAPGTKQLDLFDISSDKQTKEPGSFELSNREPVENKTLPTPTEKTEKDHIPYFVNRDNKPELKTEKPSKAPKISSTDRKKIQRKLQISNGYLMEFDKLSRVLNFLLEQKGKKRINRAQLREGTGFAERQVESLISVGSAMGLITPRVQILSPIGLIVASHDIFLENQGTLEWCHYKSAGSYQNLIWFEIFNYLLIKESPLTQEGWLAFFQQQLDGQYSQKTLQEHLRTEVRFIVDAYLERDFKKLELLKQLPDERLYQRRYANFVPIVFCAMLYDFCKKTDAHLFQVEEMALTAGSPALVFGMDTESFRREIEKLHDRGWLRYETTHRLDQVRLKPGFSAIEFLNAYFENRQPDQTDE